MIPPRVVSWMEQIRKMLDEESPFPSYQSASDNTSPSLVEAMMNGEESAWAKIAKVWGATLLQFCARKGFQNCDAEEITQNTLVKMYGAISRGRFERDGKTNKLKHWVYKIAENEIRSFCSRFRNKPSSPGGDDHQDLLANLGSVEDSGTFEVLLVSRILDLIEHDFEESTWSAFRLHHFDGLSVAEIASQMDIKPGTVRQKIFRVMQRLSQGLEVGISIASD